MTKTDFYYGKYRETKTKLEVALDEISKIIKTHRKEIKQFEQRSERLLKERNKLDVHCQIQAITIAEQNKLIANLRNGII